MVSVILSCFNGEAYLSDAIFSVLEQKYQEIELIFVNDGSTDNSLAIALVFAEKDKRLKVFSQCNSGLNSARNFGANLASAESEALLFFDADDIMHPTMILELREALFSQKDVGAVYCHMDFIDSENKMLTQKLDAVRLVPSRFWVSKVGKDEHETSFYSIYSWSSMPEACTLIKTQLFFAYGGWDEVNFSKGNTYGESVPLFGEIALNHKILFLDKVLYSYRRHSSQITSGAVDMMKIQNKIDKIMLGKARNTPCHLDRIKSAINFNRYRLPLYKYLKGSFRHELRHHSLKAFTNLFVAVIKYFISIPLFMRR